MEKLIPKVLIATPTSKRHKHLLNKWIKSLDSLTYPNFDVLLVDTTPDTESYFNLLKKKKLKEKKITILRHEWDYKKDHVVQMLAHVREEIRKYFLENDYDFLFFLDDDIFVPEWAIQRLISYNKDCVGFYVHIYRGKDKRPAILKNGEIVMGGFGIQLFTFKEINEYKKYVKKFRENKLSKKEKNLLSFIIKDEHRPQLFKAYGVGIGCLMIKKHVLAKTQFRTHPTFIYGEDLWWFTEANEKGFEFFCDTDTRPKHLNTEWGSLLKKGPKQSGDFYIAMGPSDSDKFVFLERKKGDEK